MVYDGAMSLQERLRAIRGKRSQFEFGLSIGVSPQAISQWEKGVTIPSRQNLELLCEKERLSLSWLLTGNKDQDADINKVLPQPEPTKNQIETVITKVETPLGSRDLPVFAAVEGGDGDLVVSTEPVDLVPRPWYLGEVKDGYGVIVTGESMYPAYEPGDTAIVNPRLPYMRGKIHIFTAESENSHFKATIKKLVGVTETHWKVEQFNPPLVFELDRKIWTNARRVVGKYNG